MSYLNKSNLTVFWLAFIHISLLDLCLVDANGLVFLWAENLHWLTITVHLIIALLTTAFYNGCTYIKGVLVTQKQLS